MNEYILNTEGNETLPPFANLPAFVQGYIEAAFWTSSNEMYDKEEWDSEEAQDDIREGRCGGDIPKNSGYTDIDPSSLRDILRECSAFQTEAGGLLAVAYERDYSEERAGHDFWLTRNGHGSGFWCRDALERDGLGDKLTDAAKSYSESDAYWGDDGKVYFT